MNANKITKTVSELTRDLCAAIEQLPASEQQTAISMQAAALSQRLHPRGNAVLDNNFSYHAPKPGQAEKYEELRSKAKELAYLIKQHCPDSRESSTAMTHLETAVMWANAAIARNS
jgi:hypothetical protein